MRRARRGRVQTAARRLPSGPLGAAAPIPAGAIAVGLVLVLALGTSGCATGAGASSGPAGDDDFRRRAETFERLGLADELDRLHRDLTYRRPHDPEAWRTRARHHLSRGQSAESEHCARMLARLIGAPDPDLTRDMAWHELLTALESGTERSHPDVHAALTAGDGPRRLAAIAGDAGVTPARRAGAVLLAAESGDREAARELARALAAAGPIAAHVRRHRLESALDTVTDAAVGGIVPADEVRAILLRHLERDLLSVQTAAARGLARLGDDAGHRVLLAKLDGPWARYPWPIHMALARAGHAGTRDKLRALAGGTAPEERARALLILAETGDPRAVDLALAALDADEAQVREAAVAALGAAGNGRPGSRAVAGLARALADPAVAVRSRARLTLLEAAPAGAAEAIETELRGAPTGTQPERVARFRVLIAAAAPGDADRMARARTALESPDPVTRIAALEAVPEAAARSTEPLPADLARAARTVARREADADTGSAGTRRAALRALAAVPDPDTDGRAADARRFTAALDDPNPEVRAAAVAGAAAVLDADRRLDVLADALADPDPGVRRRAAVTLLLHP